MNILAKPKATMETNKHSLAPSQVNIFLENCCVIGHAGLESESKDTEV